MPLPLALDLLLAVLLVIGTAFALIGSWGLARLSQKFFRLVPGTQFSDNFSGIQPPWIPSFWNSADASRFSITRLAKGFLRIRSTTI